MRSARSLATLGMTGTGSFMSLPPSIHVVSHPLVQHKLTKMRDKETSSANFRRLLREIGLLLGYDATRDLPLVKTHIETPIEGMEAPLLDGKKLVIVPILRAGLGLAEGMHRSGAARPHRPCRALSRSRARCRRSSTTSRSRGDISDRDVIVCDPMLATAHSAIAAVDRLKETGAKRIKFICILALRAGRARLRRGPSRRAGIHSRGRCQAQRSRVYCPRPW